MPQGQERPGVLGAGEVRSEERGMPLRGQGHGRRLWHRPDVCRRRLLRQWRVHGACCGSDLLRWREGDEPVLQVQGGLRRQGLRDVRQVLPRRRSRQGVLLPPRQVRQPYGQVQVRLRLQRRELRHATDARRSVHRRLQRSRRVSNRHAPPVQCHRARHLVPGRRLLQVRLGELRSRVREYAPRVPRRLRRCRQAQRVQRHRLGPLQPFHGLVHVQGHGDG